MNISTIFYTLLLVTTYSTAITSEQESKRPNTDQKNFQRYRKDKARIRHNELEKNRRDKIKATTNQQLEALKQAMKTGYTISTESVIATMPSKLYSQFAPSFKALPARISVSELLQGAGEERKKIAAENIRKERENRKEWEKILAAELLLIEKWHSTKPGFAAVDACAASNSPTDDDASDTDIDDDNNNSNSSEITPKPHSSVLAIPPMLQPRESTELVGQELKAATAECLNSPSSIPWPSLTHKTSFNVKDN